MELQRDEHRVHLIVYHLVFCPKRRKSVLVDYVGRRCRVLIWEVCEKNGWSIIELAVQPEHVHLFVRVNPDDSASEVCRKIKGYTSRFMRKEFRSLLKLPSLWTRSFFASTAGNVSAEVVARYIADQKGV